MYQILSSAYQFLYHPCSGSAYRKLTKEHKNLEDKYHDAVRAHEAASLLREKDMAKWKSFKQWIFCAAELAQFQKYDEEYGFSGRDKAKELFRIVTGKKYKLSQLDTLDDEKRKFFPSERRTRWLTYLKFSIYADRIWMSISPRRQRS